MSLVSFAFEVDADAEEAEEEDEEDVARRWSSEGGDRRRETALDAAVDDGSRDDDATAATSLRSKADAALLDMLGLVVCQVMRSGRKMRIESRLQQRRRAERR